MHFNGRDRKICTQIIYWNCAFKMYLFRPKDYYIIMLIFLSVFFIFFIPNLIKIWPRQKVTFRKHENILQE